MNNLFSYATKELSQDAMLCWLINWINYPESKLYSLAKDVLDMFLGDKKLPEYCGVNVQRQYKKIDVLVQFNNKYALIIEDKTNTSEHSNQIYRYQNTLKEDFPDYEIITSYIKTGIMYDEDCRVIAKTDTVINLETLYRTLAVYRNCGSEILCDFILYLEEELNYRKKIEEQLFSKNYSEALKSYYGQFLFLDKIFGGRSKGTESGFRYKDSQKKEKNYVDYIYSGTNNGGTPWTQYCFWDEEYSNQLTDSKETECHCLFWRIDCNWRRTPENPDVYIPDYYLALRHYDANTKVNEKTKERKKNAYRKIRSLCDIIRSECKYDVFENIGVRENYKESDLLFIPIKNFEKYTFEEVSILIREITDKVVNSI